jgi:hypothetical protein
MIRKAKARVHSRQRTGPPDARTFLADEAARRRPQTPPRVENDLAAALIARRRAERGGLP